MDETLKPPRPVKLLDIECEEDRLERFRSSLEKLDRNSTNGHTIPPSFNFDPRNRMPYAINPPTELLSRIQVLLPALEASNAILAQRAQADPRSVDIEHVDESMEQYIEMDLGLGVFEDHTHTKPQHATSDSDSGMSKSSTSSSDDTDTDSDTDSTSSDEIITSFKPIRPIKPLPRRSLANRPGIVLLEEHR